MISKFIAIEGLDGSGKSTLCSFLMKIFNIYNIKKVLLVRDPGGNWFSEKIRNLMFSNLDFKFISRKSFLLMMYASRVQLIEKSIIPAINNGYYVISDRFSISTIAYQSCGWNIDRKLIDLLDLKFSNFCLPGLNIYIDISPLVAIKRLLKYRKLDFIESQGISFFYRVSIFYKKFFFNRPNTICIDGNLSKKNMFLTLKDKIKIWLKKNDILD